MILVQVLSSQLVLVARMAHMQHSERGEDAVWGAQGCVAQCNGWECGRLDAWFVFVLVVAVAFSICGRSLSGSVSVRERARSGSGPWCSRCRTSSRALSVSTFQLVALVGRLAAAAVLLLLRLNRSPERFVHANDSYAAASEAIRASGREMVFVCSYPYVVALGGGRCHPSLGTSVLVVPICALMSVGLPSLTSCLVCRCLELECARLAWAYLRLVVVVVVALAAGGGRWWSWGWCRGRCWSSWRSSQ